MFSHIVCDAAYADADFKHKLVLYRSILKIYQKTHAFKHFLRGKIPINFVIPIITQPFAGESPQDIFFSGHRSILGRKKIWKLLFKAIAIKS